MILLNVRQSGRSLSISLVATKIRSVSMAADADLTQLYVDFFLLSCCLCRVSKVIMVSASDIPYLSRRGTKHKEHLMAGTGGRRLGLGESRVNCFILIVFFSVSSIYAVKASKVDYLVLNETIATDKISSTVALAE